MRRMRLTGRVQIASRRDPAMELVAACSRRLRAAAVARVLGWWSLPLGTVALGAATDLGGHRAKFLMAMGMVAVATVATTLWVAHRMVAPDVAAQRIDEHLHAQDCFLTWVAVGGHDRQLPVEQVLGRRAGRLALRTSAAEVVPMPRRWLWVLLVVLCVAVAAIFVRVGRPASTGSDRDGAALPATSATASPGDPTALAPAASGDEAVSDSTSSSGGGVEAEVLARILAARGLEATLGTTPLPGAVAGTAAAEQLRATAAALDTDELDVAAVAGLADRLEALAGIQQLGSPEVAATLAAATEALSRGDTALAAESLRSAGELHQQAADSAAAQLRQSGATATASDPDDAVIPVDAGYLPSGSQDLVREYFRRLTETSR